MLDIRQIRTDPEKFKQAISRKGADPDLVDKLLEVDDRRRSVLSQYEEAQGELNKASSEISKLHSQQKIDAIKMASEMSEKVKLLKPQVDSTLKEYNLLMMQIPNPPAEDVISGAGEEDNTVLKTSGEPKKFDFKVKDYLQIASELDLLDMERAVKIAGSRSYFFKNELVLLEFALIQYAFEILIKEGFTPMIVPVMMNRKIMEGAGYLPQGEDEIYRTQDDTYLAGTAEQPLAGYHMNEILTEKELPKRYVGFSTCFRREAGSYGKDVKGILRVHQFDKVEMFSFVNPKDSAKEHDYLVSLKEKIMAGLGLPYRVVNICAGDLGASAAKKFDVEAWIPSEEKYRETHSCSNCTDFQARRLNIKYKNKEGKFDFLHTLNGTAIALNRPIVAILENYQQKDGSILLPEVLHKYLGFDKIKKP